MIPRLVFLLLFTACALHAAPPNIVMIAVDDLNDLAVRSFTT